MRLKTFTIALRVFCCLAVFAVYVDAQSAAQTEWKRYELAQGNFSLLLPAEPKEQFARSPPDAGVSLDAYIYSTGTADASFVVQYNILGEKATRWLESAKQSFYQGWWEGAAGSFDRQMEANKLPFKAKLEEQREIKFSGYPGHEVVFSVGPLRGRIRMTLIGRQAFGVTVLGSDKLTPEDEQKFLNSVTITPKPIAAEQTETSKPGS